MGRRTSTKNLNQKTHFRIDPDSAVVTDMPITMMAWGRALDDSLAHMLIAIVDSASGNHQIGLEMSGSTGGDPVSAVSGAGGAQIEGPSATAFIEGKWTHCAAVFKGTGAQIESRQGFIHGVGGTPETTVHTPSGLDRTAICAEVGGTTSKILVGDIMWPAIWEGELSATEIKKGARGIKPDRIARSTLLNFLDMPEVRVPERFTYIDPISGETWLEVGEQALAFTGMSWSGGLITVNLFSTAAAVGDYIQIENANPSGYDGDLYRVVDMVGNDIKLVQPTDPGVYVGSADVRGRIGMARNPQQVFRLPSGSGYATAAHSGLVSP